MLTRKENTILLISGLLFLGGVLFFVAAFFVKDGASSVRLAPANMSMSNESVGDTTQESDVTSGSASTEEMNTAVALENYELLIRTEKDGQSQEYVFNRDTKTKKMLYDSSSGEGVWLRSWLANDSWLIQSYKVNSTNYIYEGGNLFIGVVVDGTVAQEENILTGAGEEFIGSVFVPRTIGREKVFYTKSYNRGESEDATLFVYDRTSQEQKSIVDLRAPLFGGFTIAGASDSGDRVYIQMMSGDGGGFLSQVTAYNGFSGDAYKTIDYDGFSGQNSNYLLDVSTRGTSHLVIRYTVDGEELAAGSQEEGNYVRLVGNNNLPEILSREALYLVHYNKDLSFIEEEVLLSFENGSRWAGERIRDAIFTGPGSYAVLFLDSKDDQTATLIWQDTTSKHGQITVSEDIDCDDASCSIIYGDNAGIIIESGSRYGDEGSTVTYYPLDRNKAPISLHSLFDLPIVHVSLL